MIQYTGFKYCPNCGNEALEVFLKNGIKCRNCGYIYFHNMASAVGGIIISNKEILLAKRAHDPCIGMFDLPGGFVDYGETLEGALKREIREEIGIEVSEPEYIGSFPNTYYYENVTYFTSDAFFVCRILNNEQPVLSTEISGVIFVKPDAIPFQQIAFESARAALRYFSSISSRFI